MPSKSYHDLITTLNNIEMKTLKNGVAWICGLMVFALLFSFNSHAQEAPKLNDAQIASVALTANQIDVDYAAIAQKKSNNADVLRFAKTMQDDHNAVIKMATDLAKKLGVTPQANAMTQSLLDGAQKTTKDLNSKSGKAFNKAYIDNEVAYHDAVINAVENVLIPQTKNAELKALFVQIMPTLKAHLEHAKMVQKEFK